MQHTISLETLGPQGSAMTEAVDKCVHCGFCLSACPTYKTMGEEMDSPRGRIYLMKEQLEGNLEAEEMLPYVDRCLGCMACVTACPSGVEYGELLAPFRAQTEVVRERDTMDRLTRLMVHETLPYPGRFRTAATLGARVAMLAGCVQQVLAPQINWATLKVLAHNGVEVVIPKGQGCCGSLAMHTGEGQRALDLASHNLTVFAEMVSSGEVDAIITNAAGCGSGMHEYKLLFKGTALEEQATAFASKVKDISVFLAELGLAEPPPLPEPLTLAYHDACHLAHAQRVTAQPRQLLRAIPNLTLVEIPEGELCCGSAGTYNLEQPELAHEIGQRKARNVVSTKAEGVVMGNIGCMMQIQTHLNELGQPLPIWHTVEVLEQAYDR